MAELYDYQKQLVNKAKHIFNEHNLVYIAAEERTGKTFVALQMLEELGYVNVLIVTKKAAISGWESVINEHFKGKFSATIINYQSLHKINKSAASVAIIDEAHANVGGYPKASKTASILQRIVYGLPIVFLSATPCAQTYASLFHQLNLSSHSPWDNYKNFYAWFKDVGVPKLIRGAGGRQIVQYDEIKEECILPIFEKYFVFLTRNDSGEFSVEPKDELVYILPKLCTLEFIKQIRQKKLLNLPSGEQLKVETISKEMHLLHSIESGVVKVDETRDEIYPQIDEKIDYIKERWGDTKDIAIFYEYIAEGKRLREEFKNANILQGTTYAEGVDLSHLKCAIVLSMNFSTSKYIQRRCRLCHPKRTEPIVIYYLLFKEHLSEAVYNCVAQKRQNFTESIYKTFSQGGFNDF